MSTVSEKIFRLENKILSQESITNAKHSLIMKQARFIVLAKGISIPEGTHSLVPDTPSANVIFLTLP